MTLQDIDTDIQHRINIQDKNKELEYIMPVNDIIELSTELKNSQLVKLIGFYNSSITLKYKEYTIKLKVLNGGLMDYKVNKN